MKEIKKENSLAVTHPELAKEWHPTKNGDLTPYDVSAGMNKRVWWQCKHGHEWRALVRNRAVLNRNCPYCSGRYPIVGETDLATTHPEIAKQWHPTLNGDLKPTDVTYGSNKKVWWQCEHGHKWQATVHSRTAMMLGCPYCSGRYPVVGETDLATTHPEIAKQWHPTLNGDLKPTDVTYGSNKKVWWQCEHGHEWQAAVNSRTAMMLGCPYCSGRYPVAGETDLATTHLEIAKQWHPTLNGDLKPTDVTYGSNKKVWWQCEHGHEWQSRVSSRTAMMLGCPYCSNKAVLEGYNDLATTHPEIAKQWHPTLNGDLKPADVTYGSGKKVWWQCEHGHEWQATVNDTVSNLNSCPYCGGYRIIVGENDLATTHPEIAKQWHPTKNGDLKPEDVTYGCNKKVWWKCEYGHEWQTKINNRAFGKGCPHCSHNGTSNRELVILDYIKKHTNLNVVHRFSDFGFEIDIYIPSLKTGIEYDGHLYHKDIEKDIFKNEQCKLNGIKLYRIREDKLPKLNGYSKDFYYTYHREKDFLLILQTIVQEIFDIKTTVAIMYQDNEMHKFIAMNKTNNSLAELHPDIAKQWHPTRNGVLTPSMVKDKSNLKVWWQCEHGHEWQATVNNRTSSGKGCPYCSGRYPIVGQNDLATIYPEIAKQWHPTLNGDLKPTDVKPCSGKMVWWINKNGNITQSRICHKTKYVRQKHKVV